MVAFGIEGCEARQIATLQALQRDTGKSEHSNVHRQVCMWSKFSFSSVSVQFPQPALEQTLQLEQQNHMKITCDFQNLWYTSDHKSMSFPQSLHAAKNSTAVA